MDQLWRFRAMIVVGLVAALVFITMFAHNEGRKKLVARETEFARVREELGNRLDKAIPRYRGVTVSPKDAFELIETSRLDKVGADVVVRDVVTGHVCRGLVMFVDQTGGHFDQLLVDQCYDPRQPKRVYSAGVRIQ